MSDTNSGSQSLSESPPHPSLEVTANVRELTQGGAIGGSSGLPGGPARSLGRRAAGAAQPSLMVVLLSGCGHRAGLGRQL